MLDIVKMTDVFISYSHDNTEFARKLVRAVENRGFDAWIDEEDIPKASEWREDIRAGIEGAEAFLFIISPSSVMSPECGKEIQLAVTLGKRIIPVVYQLLDKDEYTSAIHPVIGRHNWIFADDVSKWNKTLDEIIMTLRTNIDHVRTHTRLTIESRRWRDFKQDPSYLLRDKQLESAETWLRQNIMSDPQPTHLQADFIEASRKAQTLFEKAQTQLERQRKVLASGISIITVIAAIISFGLFQLAQRNADVAVSAAQAAEAQLALNKNDLVSAIELSLNATQIKDPPIEAVRALGSAVNAPGPRFTLIGHTNEVNIVVYHPTESLAISGAKDFSAILWDTGTGEIRHTLNGHSDWVNAVAFNPDGNFAFSGSSDGYVINWDVQLGRENYRFLAHSGGVVDIVTSSDGRYLLTVGCSIGSLANCEASDIKFWDIADGSFVQTIISEHPGYLRTAVINATSDKIYYGGDDGIVFEWDTIENTTKQIHARHAQENNLSSIRDIALSPDGKLLATASADRNAIVWDLENARIEQILSSHSARVLGITFSPDGRLLSTVSEDKNTLVWSVQTGALLQRFIGHQAEISSVDFSQDSRFLITSSIDMSLRIWDLGSNSELRRINLNGVSAFALAHDSTGNTMAVGDSHGRIILFDNSSTEEFIAFREIQAHNAAIFRLVFGPGDAILYAASSDATLSAWDVNTGERLQEFTGHTTQIWAMDLSPDGNLLVSGSDNTRVVPDGDNYRIILWDAHTGEILAEWNEHQDSVLGLDFSPDGQSILSASADFTLIHRDVASGEIRHTLNGHSDWVIDATFNSDGSQALSASADGSMILWDVASGDIIQRYVGHVAQVTRVTFLDDDRFAVSGSRDNNLIVWDLERETDLYTLSGNSDTIWSLLPLGNENRLLSANFDGTIIEWSISTSLSDLQAQASNLLIDLRLFEG